MIHWDMEQRTDEWRKYKAGKISASEIDNIIPGPRGYKAARMHYMDRLAQEIITGEMMQTYCSPEMQRGIDLEPEALTEFEIESGEMLESAGFIDHPTIEGSGASPDSLIGKPEVKKGVELKCLIGANHTNEMVSIEKGNAPKYDTQIQWSMMCAGVDEWYYVLYNPDCLVPELKLYYTIIKRDEKKCNEIYQEVMKFKAELLGYIETMRGIMEAAKRRNK